MLHLYRCASLFCRALVPLHNRTLELIQQKRLLSQQLASVGGVFDDVIDLASAIGNTWSSNRKHYRRSSGGKALPGAFGCLSLAHKLQPASACVMWQPDAPICRCCRCVIAVTLRAAVVAVIACNRLNWLAKSSGNKLLGDPVPLGNSSSSLSSLSAQTSSFVGVASRTSRRVDIPTQSWRRSYEKYLFLLPGSQDNTADMQRVLDSITMLPSMTVLSSADGGGDAVVDDGTMMMHAISCFAPMHAVQMTRAALDGSAVTQTLFRGLRHHYKSHATDMPGACDVSLWRVRSSL